MPALLQGQRILENTYWFYFSDKDDNGYSVDIPEAFLSQRAIDRRAWQMLPVTLSDLPVTASYVDSLEQLGLDVLFTSKWLNGAVVHGTNADLIDTLHHISFIDTLQWEPDPMIKYYPSVPGYDRFDDKYTSPPSWNYGVAIHQVGQMKVDDLHAFGYTGKGVWIAVLDAGFTGLKELPAFETLVDEGRIIAEKNFVEEGEDIYSGHSHGMSVSSLIVADWQDTLVGTAPDASLILIKTENPKTETRLEEFSWIAGAEWADSLGADIFNTSLGYTTFDDSTTNYTWEDMDGSTSHISIANGMTAEKGILSVTSAGNSGNDSWYRVGAPADARNILAVGAVDSTGQIASFSSRGPSYDLRIKPEVSAMGSLAWVQSTNGSARRGSGTSYASPLIAGATASLWQAYPTMPAKELRNWIIQTGSRKSNPDSEYGFGIPSFRAAYYNITRTDLRNANQSLHVYPNPVQDRLFIDIPAEFGGTYVCIITDLQGRIIHETSIPAPGSFIIPSSMKNGLYILEMSDGEHKFMTRIIKN